MLIKRDIILLTLLCFSFVKASEHNNEVPWDPIKDSIFDWRICCEDIKNPRSWLLMRLGLSCINVPMHGKNIKACIQWLTILNQKKWPPTIEEQLDYIKTLDKVRFGQRFFLSDAKNSQGDHEANPEEKIVITLLRYGVDVESIKIDSPNNIFKHYAKRLFCNPENLNTFIYQHNGLLVWEKKNFLQTLTETFSSLRKSKDFYEICNNTIPYCINNKIRKDTTLDEDWKEVLRPCCFMLLDNSCKKYYYKDLADSCTKKKSIETFLLCLKKNGIKIPKFVLKQLIIEKGMINRPLKMLNAEESMYYALKKKCTEIEEIIGAQIDNLNSTNQQIYELPEWLQNKDLFKKKFTELQNTEIC